MSIRVVQRHGGFVAAAVGLELAGLDGERDFVFVVGRWAYGGGDGLVVVEDDVLEGVGDVVLQLGRGLRAEGVDELARVGIGADLRVVGVGVAILHQEVVQREVDLVFADVVGERVHDLAAFLIPDVGLVLDEHDGRLAADFAGAAAQVAVELVLEEPVHVVGAVFLLHDHAARSIRPAFRTSCWSLRRGRR